MAVFTTVQVPATSYALTTLINVKADLNLLTTADDGFLTTSINRASAAIAAFCNRVFPIESVTDNFFLNRDPYPYQVPGGVKELKLTRFPVVAMTSIVENAVLLTENTDFVVNYARGLVTRLGADGFASSWPAVNIVVIYSGGFAIIPADLEEACSRLVQSRYAARGRDPLMKSENVVGVYEASWWVSGGIQASNLPPDIADALTVYRTPVVA